MTTAVLWIRDGVLVDRMHINPVAFAFAVWVFCAPESRRNTTLEGLINFGFEKSGLSCQDKMRLYNTERENILIDVESAASYYNLLASEAANFAGYFEGAVELLQDLQSAGVCNFITSAIEEGVLNDWCRSQQGMTIAPYLHEVLGKRNNFSKGRDHFEFVSQRLSHHMIYYVADAVTEIQIGKVYSRVYNIIPIGFGNVITAELVAQAVKLVVRALTTGGLDVPFPIKDQDIQFDASKVSLADQYEIEANLSNAGAESVITGAPENIMDNLRKFFEERSLLQPTTASAKQS